MADSSYNLISGDRKFGPYSRQELAALLADGEIALDSLCISIGDGEIQRISELFGAPTKPATPKAVKRRPAKKAATHSPQRQEAIREENTAPIDAPHSDNADDANDDEGWHEETVWEEDDQVAEDELDYETDEERDDDLFEGHEPEGHEPDTEMDPDDVVCALHPSILGYPKLLLSTLTFGIVALLFLFLSPLIGLPVDALTSVMLLLSGLHFALLLVLRHFDNYYVTRTRAEVVRGIIARSSNEVRISDVRRIDVDKKGLLGLLNVGDVKLSSAGTGGFDVIFSNVRAGHRVKRILRRIQKNPAAPKPKLLGHRWFGS